MGVKWRGTRWRRWIEIMIVMELVHTQDPCVLVKLHGNWIVKINGSEERPQEA